MSKSGPPRPALVLLAAGASTRLGVCKALVDLGPGNAIELLARAGASFDQAPVLVIAGAHHREILAACANRSDLEVVFNGAWRTGPLSSAALAHRLRPGCDLCLAPVDAPLVSRAVFERLLEHWMEAGSPSQGWLAPRFAVAPDARARTQKTSAPGTRDELSPGFRPPRYGHPIVVGHGLLSRIEELAPNASLRDLRRWADPLSSTEVSDPAVLDDLDTPEDLERIRARARP